MKISTFSHQRVLENTVSKIVAISSLSWCIKKSVNMQSVTVPTASYLLGLNYGSRLWCECVLDNHSRDILESVYHLWQDLQNPHLGDLKTLSA